MKMGLVGLEKYKYSCFKPSNPQSKQSRLYFTLRYTICYGYGSGGMETGGGRGWGG